jgi:hypothetical protein
MAMPCCRSQAPRVLLVEPPPLVRVAFAYGHAIFTAVSRDSVAEDVHLDCLTDAIKTRGVNLIPSQAVRDTMHFLSERWTYDARYALFNALSCGRAWSYPRTVSAATAGSSADV